MARVNEGSGNPAGWLCNGPRLTDRGTGLMLPVPQPHFCWGFLLWLFVCLPPFVNSMAAWWNESTRHSDKALPREGRGEGGGKGTWKWAVFVSIAEYNRGEGQFLFKGNT